LEKNDKKTTRTKLTKPYKPKIQQRNQAQKTPTPPFSPTFAILLIFERKKDCRFLTRNRFLLIQESEVLFVLVFRAQFFNTRFPSLKGHLLMLTLECCDGELWVKV
jgi:hypothetical protein